MLKITKLPLSPAPIVNTLCSLWYKVDDGEYQLSSTNITVKPNGDLVTPFLLQYPSGALTLTLMVKSNCGDEFIEKQINIPQAPPVTTTTTLPVITWECDESYCPTQNTCPAGYTLSPDGSTCTKVEEAAPTSQQAPINAAPAVNNVYSQYGSRLYLGEWDAYGNGPAIEILTPFWRNVPSNQVEGPMNRNGIWVDNNADGIRDALVAGAKLNVSVRITSTTEKDFFIGIGGDNKVMLTVNGGTPRVNKNTINDLNFKWWHIYRIRFRAGENIITVTGEGDGTVQDSVAMEIYENTAEQLQSATSYATLNVRFKTADVRGGILRITECPAGYQAINDGGVWKCQRILAQPAAITNTGMLVCSTRRRLVNGAPDGYIEVNDQDGEGPYLPPVQNLQLCPVGVPVTTTTTVPPVTTTTTAPVTTTTTSPPPPPHLNPLLYEPIGNGNPSPCSISNGIVQRHPDAAASHVAGVVEVNVTWSADNGCSRENLIYTFLSGQVNSEEAHDADLDCNGQECNNWGWQITNIRLIP